MLIADLHIHSKYSRATSGECVPEHLDLWARRKGIGLLGTGDFTHPAWRAELLEKLVEAEDGLYALREDARLTGAGASAEERPRFVVTGEISSIYKKDGRTRKVHNLILLPSLDAADELAHRLEAIGNIHSDGRPILGLDSRDLLEITLEACPDAVFIPAHIWTPHFSLFGAFSGFDTIEACFGDLTPHIHALETGLSSDPPMNWRLSALDGYQLVSNSDAHSPAKLGREANLLDIHPSYAALKKALDTGDGLAGTVEFYPEEGKYHFDGHRNCRQCLTPAETEAAGGRCPVCGKKITIGVLHRVEELADRPEGYEQPGGKPFESLVPLPEVIAASAGGAAAGKRVNAQYEAMLSALGPEFYILRQAPLEDIRHVAGPCVEEGIRRLRAGKVGRSPGYDGAYGKITLLDPAEREALNGQVSLFGAVKQERKGKTLVAAAPVKKGRTGPAVPEEEHPAPGLLDGLNAAQMAAVEAEDRAVAVIAGPGTGKTRTLVACIAWLVREKGVKPGEITAVTFTNRAAGELRERLERELGGKRALRGMTVGTFHAICLDLLSKRPGGARLMGEFEAVELAAEALREAGERLSPAKFLREASRIKNGLPPEEADFPQGAFALYCARQQSLGLMDYDDLLVQGLEYWNEAGGGAAAKGFRYLLVDEFQDSNPIQYELVRAWNRAGKSLFVIGDPDQSIYGFRGSDPGCFRRLEEDFQDVKEIHLTKNYRSAPAILRAALPIVARNGGPVRVLEPTRPEGLPVRLVTADSPLAEGIYVAKEIGRQVGGIDMLDADRTGHIKEGGEARSFDHFAVLYRTHRQGGLLETCLRKEGIPCVVAGRDDFLADSAVRGALAFFQALLDPEDGAALPAALRLGFHCPADLAQGAARVWAEAGGDAAARLEAVKAAYPQVGLLLPWAALADALLPRLAKDKPRKLLEVYGKEKSLSALEPMERLMNMAVFHPTMAAFLQNLTLGQEGDLLRSAGGRYEAGYVTLMTLHAAKGLEYPVVFLCGARKGLIPYESERRAADGAEERRLLFVGMTRAREELILLTGPEPSPFLADLPQEAVQAGPALSRRRAREAEQLRLF